MPNNVNMMTHMAPSTWVPSARSIGAWAVIASLTAGAWGFASPVFADGEEAAPVVEAPVEAPPAEAPVEQPAPQAIAPPAEAAVPLAAEAPAPSEATPTPSETTKDQPIAAELTQGIQALHDQIAEQQELLVAAQTDRERQLIRNHIRLQEKEQRSLEGVLHKIVGPNYQPPRSFRSVEHPPEGG